MVKYNMVYYTCPTCGNTKANETGSQPRRCHMCEQIICKECGINYICQSCGEQHPDLERKYKFIRILKILFMALIFVGVGGGLLLALMTGSMIGMYILYAGGGFMVISIIYMSIEKGLYKKTLKKYREKHNIPEPEKQYRWR